MKKYIGLCRWVNTLFETDYGLVRLLPVKDRLKAIP